MATLALALLPPASGAAAPAPTATRHGGPANLIFMIGDGFGPAYVTMARDYSGRPLTLDSILVGAAGTASADSRVTDSGAAATALASGVRTDNREVGVDAQGRARRTILEAAEAKGLATGIVVTSRVTHATPAAFAAHVRDRDAEDSIAVQMARHGIDVLLGGGERHFRPAGSGGSRKDGRDLVRELEARGATVAERPAALRAARTLPLVGLFAPSHLDYVIDRDTTREPPLDQMVRVALERLAGRSRGFLLMVEGSRIDHAGHANDAATAVREVLEFDAAVRAAVEYARRDRRTLVVVSADHETGGLSLGREVEGTSYYEWQPEVLRRARRSAEAMAQRIQSGEDARTVLARDAGVEDLSADELKRLRAAKGDTLELAIAEAVSRRARIGWTTQGHSAVDVPVWAFGPGAESLRGFRHADELGRALARLMRLEIGGVIAP